MIEQTINEILGIKFRIFREMTKKSQTKLGEVLGVTFQQVQKYEKGESKITIEHLVTICKWYNDTIRKEGEGKITLDFFLSDIRTKFDV